MRTQLDPSLRENQISYEIRKSIFEVYDYYGPGALERIYVAALVKELLARGLTCRTEAPVNVEYKGEDLKVGFRLDLLVEDLVIVEVKSVEQLTPVHHKIVLTYLKLTKKKLALLVNVGSDDIHSSIYRKVNGL
jgi:GxxExxY protein